MRNKMLFFLLSVIFYSVSIYSQNINVTGIVKDQEGSTLIGASVIIKGTSIGTVTDIDGKFLLSGVAKNSVLVFKYIGYIDKEVIADNPVLNVTLESNENHLDEILVVAYGTASKAGYTGSASSINKEEISRAQVSSVSRLLQGTASGVQSVASSGQPGSDAAIYIRGIGSINASSSPLYVVDGAPFDGALNSINPEDIESINVLKDASSTALYGSRAGNGLVIITTKQGKKNSKARVDASFRYGVSSRAVSDYDKVSTNDYFQLYWEALRNQELYVNGKSPADAAKYASENIVGALGINPYGSAYPNPVGLDGKIVEGAKPLWNDDWSKEYTQSAHRTEGQVGISGGSEDISYYISLGYLDDQGIALASSFKRYSGRVNLNANIKPWLRFTTGISLINSNQESPQGDDSETSNTLNFARLIPNFYPIWERNDDGSFKLDDKGNRIIDYGNYRPSGASPRFNHLGSSKYDFSKVQRDIASVRAGLEIDLYKGLQYRGSLNIDYTNKNNHNYTNPKYGEGSYSETPGEIEKYNYRTTGFTANNILSYETSFNSTHNIKALAGQEYYEYNTKYIYGSRSGIPILGLTEPAVASVLNDFTGNSDQYKLLSFFGNIDYNYSHKYYASASLRTDGSSRFSADSRWGLFWSVGASWRISEEEFIKSCSAINSLKLRASYGGQGNDNIGSYYAYQGLFSIKNNLGESGFVTSSLENKDLKWETNLNFNVGIDYALLNSRISGSFEFFTRRSKDLLFELPKPLSTGYSGYSANVGALKNTGIEFSITGTPVKTKDWQWDITVNGTHYKNKITELPQDDIISGNYIKRVGGSVYDFYLVEWAGINPANGLPQWYKTDDNGQRVVTENYTEANNAKSKIVAGSALPDLVGGFSTNLRFKDFEFSALFAYSLGGKIYNADKQMILNNGSTVGRAMSTELLDRWTPENPNTNVPRMQTTNLSWKNPSTSTRFLIDADYLRLKNITLGYNIPKSLLRNIYLKDLKVYAQAENLLTVFGEQGIDPEQTLSGSTYYRYPAMKTISFGVNVSF